MTIQGRNLLPGDIESIRRLIADHPDWHRTRLYKHLCQLLNWRTDTGLLKDMACRSMLRKLEQRQLIVLPPARTSGNRARKIKDIEHDTEPVQAPLRQIRPVEITMIKGRGAADDLFHPWVQVKNLASHILSACVRRLRSDWHQRYGHDLCLVETFVDRSRFVGTCYQAANWLRVGQTRGRSRQDRYKRLRVPVKDLYEYPLTDDFKKRLYDGI